MKISLGSDHAGFRYKEAVKAHLSGLGHEVVDFGTDSAESCDYPVFIRPAAEAVARGECECDLNRGTNHFRAIGTQMCRCLAGN